MITWDASGCEYGCGVDVDADADEGRNYGMWRIARCEWMYVSWGRPKSKIVDK